MQVFQHQHSYNVKLKIQHFTIFHNPQWFQIYMSVLLPITYRYQFTCTAHTFSALFLSLDVLHPSTSSAHSTPSTNSSHPTQGRYQPFVYLLCAIQGARHYFFSGCSFIPAHQVPIQATQHKDDTLYPSQAYLLFLIFRVLHQAEALRSRTPPQFLEIILFTEFPNSCDSPLMCAKRVLTTCLTSRHPQNA